MLNDLNVRLKIFALQAFHMLLLMILGLTGIIGMVRIKSEFRATNENHTLALVQLTGILDDVHQIRSLTILAARLPTPDELPALAAEFARIETERVHLWRQSLATDIGGSEAVTALGGERAWQAYLNTVVRPILTASSVPAIKPVVKDPNLETVLETIRHLIVIQKNATSSSYVIANSLFVKFGIFDLILVCAGLGLAGVLLFWDYVRLRRSAAQ